MRKAFPEFYNPDEQELKRLLTSGLLVLDTNVLFELYRVTTADRVEIQELLEQYFADRVWIPWRVGFEFHRKRLDIVRAQAGNYSRLLAFGSADESALLQQLEGLQLPKEVAEHLRSLIPDLVSAIENARQSYRETVLELTSEHVITHEVAIRNDPVLRWLNEMIGPNVGERWGEERLAAEQETGRERIANVIPPGYKDAGKAREDDQVGDYLIWRQILDKAADLRTAAAATPGVLFVSNDVKDDWVEKSGGHVVGPRHELRAEFQQSWPGGAYHQVTLYEFIELAKAHLGAAISPEAVRRINELKSPAGPILNDEDLRRGAMANTTELMAALARARHEAWLASEADREQRRDDTAG
jgi:hypothetical protein